MAATPLTPMLATIQSGSLVTECFPCVTSVDQLVKLKERIPTGARVAVDTEGSPNPFCIFLSFLAADSTLVYGSVAVKLLAEPSVLDLKFQAGVGWDFRPAIGEEVGIDYLFIDPDEIVRKVSFEDGVACEKSGRTIITDGRVATADQMRALASGEAVSFTRGRTQISVTHDTSQPLIAAEISADAVVKTGEIWHLIGDPNPAYQNLTIEKVLTKSVQPMKVEEPNVRDGCFYILELADPTGKKTDYIPVHPGCTFQKTVNKSFVRLVPQKGGGSTIDLPPTNLELGAVQGFLQGLVAENQVTFVAHNKTKEEMDLKVLVKDDSHDIVKQLDPFMKAANLKAVGSSVVFHLLHSILKKINSPPILLGGDRYVDLVTCSDIHSLPVEVCVLTILYPMLRELSVEEVRDALRSSITVDGDEQRAKVQAALDELVSVV